MAEKNPDESLSIVVVSHDGFADVWPAFFTLLFRFWPDRPYPLYLISNHKTFADDRVAPLPVGDDLSWSQTLARGLARVPARTVLLMLEDFYLTGPVDTARVRRLHKTMAESGAAYLRLFANPGPDRPHPEYPDVGLIAAGAPYRSSLQMALWDRAALLGLLRDNESAWDFEIKGSRRSDSIAAPFLSVSEGSAIAYRQVVRRGKWLPEAIRAFAPLGIRFDQSQRPVESELRLWWERTLLRRWLGRAWTMAFR